MLPASVTAGTNISYTWAFGDGTLGYGDTVSHTNTAVYTAAVTASNSVSTMTAATVVTIIEPVLPTHDIYLSVVLRGYEQT